MERTYYRQDLDKNAANHVPLSPVSFLARSALTFPSKIAVVDGARRFTYSQFHQRCLRLASALESRGIGDGDTVAVLAPNVPALLEAHYGVPLVGAVLNALNTRLDAASIGFCLQHGEAKLVLVDAEYLDLIKAALTEIGADIPLVVIASDAAAASDEMEYEDFIASGDSGKAVARIADEWSAITLGYTSGTTGDPKGVVCHHRGAYLNALGNALAAHLDENSVYLWTLPMFHCNGWSHTWAVTAVGGTHVCLRKIDPAAIYALITREKGTRCLTLVSCLGDWPGERLTFHGAPIPLPEGEVRLAVEVDGATQRFLLHSPEGWHQVGPVLDASIISDEGGRGEHASFTGAFVGLVAHDLTGQGWGADVTSFHYAPRG